MKAYMVYCLVSEWGDHIACFETEREAFDYGVANASLCGHSFQVVEDEYDPHCICKNKYLPEPDED